MPRGKKARTDEGESKEAVAKPKGKGKEEPVVVEEEKKKEATLAEITTYIKEHQGNSECLAGLKELLLSSSLSRKLVNSVMSCVFELIGSTPTLLAWGKSLIQLLTSDILDPKTRVKEAFFFPNPDSEKRLIHFLNKAEKTMLVAVFTLTNDDLTNAMRRARDRGVTVRIISDDDLMTMNGSDVQKLHDEGFQVRVDLDRKAQMHHKFTVIDDYLLITGSFNWTKQAVNKNQENIVVMDDPVLARAYTDEFNRMWEQFAPSVDRYLGGVKSVAPAQKKEEAVEKKEEHVEVPVNVSDANAGGGN